MGMLSKLSRKEPRFPKHPRWTRKAAGSKDREIVANCRSVPPVSNVLIIKKILGAWDPAEPSLEDNFIFSLGTCVLLARYDRVNRMLRITDRKSTRLNSSHIPLSRM